MVFTKVILVYGVPCQIVCQNPGVCDPGDCMCKEETIARQKHCWVSPCCGNSDFYIRGIQVDQVDRKDLDITYGEPLYGCRCKIIEEAYYISPSGERYSIDDISENIPCVPDYKVSSEILKSWEEMGQTRGETPRVYLLLDDCVSCS